MPNFSNSKNILYQSPIYAEGDVHVGDIYNIQGAVRKIPFQLNSLPFIAKEEVVGRKDDFTEVKKMLEVTDRLVLVNGVGGIGKTTLAKYFTTLSYQDYNYIAWVNNTSSIKEAFANDLALIDSLHLKADLEALPQDKNWTEKAFVLILNRMRQLASDENGKKNLLILDNVGSDIEDLDILEQVALKPNWKVLATSRNVLEGFKIFELLALAKEEAMQLFYQHYRYEKNDQLVEEILQRIAYHTLSIEVIAKTAEKRMLKLQEVLDIIKKKLPLFPILVPT
ncbi:MAG: NB-ARC domain-containing protein [Bacteroidota bacterium]